MTQRRVLFLDAAQLTAYRGGAGELHAEGVFTADAAGLADFTAYLALQPRGRFMLLADVAEEGFQSEEIPHSTGQDRRALIARKLAQHFYGTPYAIAHAQGRLKSGRRDERLLLMALTQPQDFEPWLTRLQASRAMLAGLYTLPQLIPGLLPRQAPAQCLLLTHTRAGLRQTFCVDGQMRFSRLTPLANGSAEESAMAALLEAMKMHQYLASQRLIERGQALATYLLVHAGAAAAMRAHCQDTADLRFEIIDLLETARRVGLRAAPADAETLFCQLLAQHPPAEQFAPPAERQHYRLWQARLALQGASALIVLCGLFFAAARGLEIQQQRAAIEQAQQQVQIDQQRYAATLQTLPNIPMTNDNLHSLVDRYQQVTRRAVGPAPLLTQLSRSLDAFPDITLENLEWALAGELAELTVAAQLPAEMQGDPHGRSALLSEFTQHLGRTPDTSVSILQPPLQSSKTLRSSDATDPQEAPKFVFRVTQKL